jgi:hypothetical protein
MSTSISFTTGGFYVQSVTYVSPARIRVRFTADPKATSPAVSSDGLNLVNYAVTGPTPAGAILSVATVGSDTQSLDLILATPLPSGSWTVTVSNVTTQTGTLISSPTSGSFVVFQQANVTSLTAGVEAEDASTIIRKHLAPALAGPNWDALIAALSVGDDINWQNAKLAFDQFFKSTASGKYLDRLGANDGQSRPVNVGMVDDLFRKLIIQLSTNKITHNALRQIVEIFYGTDSVRAYVETALEEPFHLTAGQDLTWLMDEKVTFTTTFINEQFSQISAVTGVELAAVLTKTMRDAGYEGYALAVINSATGGTRVRLYSASLGLKSFARVTAGTAQPYLRFPAFLDVYAGGTVSSSNTWAFSYADASHKTTRIAVNTIGTPIDLSLVRAGDYVVFGSGVGGVTPGSYQISNVVLSTTTTGQYFEVPYDLGYLNVSLIQTSNYNYQFFRPTKANTNAGSRTVVVAQTTPNVIDVQIPATSQAVSRDVHDAAYGRLTTTPYPITGYLRDSNGLLTLTGDFSVNTPVVGSTVLLDSFKTVPARAWVSPGTPGSGIADASYGACWSTTSNSLSANGLNSSAVMLADGNLLTVGGSTLALGAFTTTNACNRFKLLAPNPTPVNDGSEANGAIRQQYQWTATANLTTARELPGLSLMADGRVMASGGAPNSLSSVEIYNPGTNTWTTVNPMATGRQGHTQTTVSNGKILVTGGVTSADVTAGLASTEIYDPATLAWTAGPTMSTTRYNHRAVNLKDGRVMVIGGEPLNKRYPVDSSTLVYWPLDEASGTSIADISGNAVTLTATAAGTIAIKRVNNARNLGANSASGGTLGANATVMADKWTVEFLVPGSVGGAANGAVVAYSAVAGGTLATNTLMMIGIDATQHVFWRWENGSNVVIASGTATTALDVVAVASGVFIAVRKTLTATSCCVDLFVDGSFNQRWTVPLANNTTGGASSKWYLNLDPRSSAHYGGFIDEVRISSVARTETEISLNCIRTKGGLQSGGYLTYPVGETLNSTEIYDPATNAWVLGPSMTWARSMFKAQVLPDGRVIVIGGGGRRYDQPFPAPGIQHVFAGAITWPNLSIADTEIYDPATNTWSLGPACPVGLINPSLVYLPTKKVILAKSAYTYDNFNYSTQTSSMSASNLMVLDVTTMKWSYHPLTINTAYRDAAYHVGSDVVLMTGGATLNFGNVYNGYTNMDLLIPGADKISAAGINGIQTVVTSSASSITVSTPNYPHFCTPNIDPASGYMAFNGTQYLPSTYKYTASLIAKTTGVVTVTLPTTDGLTVGQRVFFNSIPTLVGSYSSGYKILTAVTSTTVSYAETSGTIGSQSATGTVFVIPQNTGVLTSATAAAQTTGDLGPYILDPVNGLSVTSTASTLTTALLKFGNYDRLSLASLTGFASSGYVVLAFGFANQSRPIKYTAKIGSNQLLFDFAYDVEYDYPVGTSVTMLYSQNAWVPPDPSQAENLYMTGTPAGLQAALNTLEASSATGIELDLNVVYPGARGLGKEENSTSATPPSDVVKIWGV